MHASSPLRRTVAVVAIVALLAVTWVLAILARNSAATPAASALEPAVVSSLAAQGILVKSATDESAVSPSVAVTAAQAALPLTQDASASAALVMFSDVNTGPIQADGTVDPSYVDREAWAVVFDHVEMPLLGPPGTKGGSYDSDTVVFVDAKTGDYLEGIAYGAPNQ